MDIDLSISSFINTLLTPRAPFARCMYLVKISQGLIDLNKQTLVGEVHNITLTLNRDMNTKPIVEWQNDQCFKL